VVKVLHRIGFRYYNLTGDHYVMAKYVEDHVKTVTVYLKPELKRGTLRGIIRNAGISRDEFLSLLN